MGNGRRMRLPGRQRGLALLMLLTLFALSGAYLLVSVLNKSSVALSLARANKDRTVLQEAKAALISWAVGEASQPTSGQGFQPGALPCPDVNNDGVQDYSGLNCTAYLGRLPYKTLGVEDLRDASGERLWYGVSGNFMRSTGNVINSDKQGLPTVTVTGLVPASNVIAVVLAPGARVGNQDRSVAGANTASNYLESTNGVANSVNFVTATENLTDPVNSFNDQLLAISHQDLFSLVEPVVGARVQRDIVRQYIYDATAVGTSTNWTDGGGPDKSRYFDAWGAFPFAAPFADPGISSYTGTAGTLEGLLPIIGSLNYYWNGGSGSVVKTGGSGSISAICSTPGSPNTILRCDITSNCCFNAPQFRMSGTVPGIGFSFVALPQVSTNVSTSGINGTRSISGSVNSAGTGTVMLDATMPLSFFGTTITVTIDNPVTSAIASTTGSDIAGWFNNNQWYKQIYYAVSPGYVPGGIGSCNAINPRCLSVASLPAPYANPTTDTRAVLILAGRSLNGSARPSASVTNYVEAQNAITAQNIVTGNYAFQHGSSRAVPVTINDRAIVVAP